ncbi:hypothetical protein HPB51_020418 [Rhipicephalus microplus]|uniref:TLC domain-containing protein n=1 Tax=Rhipicephalus microplus TaxID=6941 RepID=A0A9J6DWZ9_RHIMP|nr:hypothetical protein HPB51_020418 [Rhipicephalus microplus]
MSITHFVPWIVHTFTVQEGYLPSINKLWEGYPHNEMSFMFKFYFIIQLAYWLHCYPELYFQKTKKVNIRGPVEMSTPRMEIPPLLCSKIGDKDEMYARITTATLPLIFFLVSYILK